MMIILIMIILIMIIVWIIIMMMITRPPACTLFIIAHGPDTSRYFGLGMLRVISIYATDASAISSNKQYARCCNTVSSASQDMWSC